MLGSVTGELGKHFVGVHKTPFTIPDQYQRGRRALDQASRSGQRVHEANPQPVCSEAWQYDSQLRRREPDPLQEGSNTTRSLPQGRTCPLSKFQLPSYKA